MSRSRYHSFVIAIIMASLVGIHGQATAAAQASQAERDMAAFVVLAEGQDDPGSPVQLSKVALIYSHFDAVFNGLDANAAAELVDEDAVIETPLGTFTGPNGLIEFVSILHRANPDAVFAITTATARAGGVQIEWRMSASGYVTDPNELVVAVMVERSGMATITFEDQVVSAASFAYETAISPLLPEAVALYPVPSSPGQTDF